MNGKIFTNICRKRCHTSDIELQIVRTVWLTYNYITWNIKVKFTLTMFNSIYIIMCGSGTVWRTPIVSRTCDLLSVLLTPWI